MKSLLKKLTVVILAFFSVQAYAQQDIRIYTLQNGMHVFAKYDPFVPDVYVNLTVRAGTSDQTENTCGFFELYRRLFLLNAMSQPESPFSVFPVQSECNYDGTFYSAEVTTDFLDSYLHSLNLCLSSFSVEDFQIKKEFNRLLAEVSEYEKSPSSFLTQAVNSKVHSESPWKIDTGVYPALFAGYTEGELRTILSEISCHWYKPENCALFITGNIREDEIYSLCARNFSSFKERRAATSFTLESVEGPVLKDERKFVITSENFTDDIAQFIVEYKSLTAAENDILKGTFTPENKNYNKFILSSKDIALAGKDYADASSWEGKEKSLFIFQAICRTGETEGLNPAKQSESLLQGLSKKMVLDRKEFVNTQNLIMENYRQRFSTGKSRMALLAGTWAASEEKDGKNFYFEFLNFSTRPLQCSLKPMTKKALKEKPFIFVILSRANYEKYEKDFSDEGFALITEKDLWYKNEVYRNELCGRKKKALLPQEEKLYQITGTTETSSADRFYFLQSDSISTFSLSNAVPAALFNSKTGKRCSVSIGINGGELFSPEKQRLLFSVVVDAVAENLRKELTESAAAGKLHGNLSVDSFTEETVSFITIECDVQDFEEAVCALTKTIVFGDIKPVTADKAANYCRHRWSQDKASLIFQLRQEALKNVYRGTSYEKLFGTKDPVLKETSLLSINKSYSTLLDASLYSVAIAGNITEEKAISSLEKAFALLKEESLNTMPQKAKATLPSKKASVALLHTFTTDKKAEEAGPGVPVLIPTSEFMDPALLVFKAPGDWTQTEIFNALLSELSLRIQQKLPQAQTGIQRTTHSIECGMISADRLGTLSSLEKAYRESYDSLKKALKDQNDFTVKRIKSRWLLENSDFSNDSLAKKIHMGLLSGRAMEYLDSFLFVQNADAGNILEVFEECFTENPYIVYSADLKK